MREGNSKQKKNLKAARDYFHKAKAEGECEGEGEGEGRRRKQEAKSFLKELLRPENQYRRRA